MCRYYDMVYSLLILFYRNRVCWHCLCLIALFQSYASILYLRIPPGFRIILRGQDVVHHNIVNDMMMREEVTYRPQAGTNEFSADVALLPTTVTCAIIEILLVLIACWCFDRWWLSLRWGLWRMHRVMSMFKDLMFTIKTDLLRFVFLIVLASDLIRLD